MNSRIYEICTTPQKQEKNLTKEKQKKVRTEAKPEGNEQNRIITRLCRHKMKKSMTCKRDIF